MINGPSVGYMYRTVIDHMYADMHKRVMSDQQLERAIDEMYQFKLSVQHGSVEHLQEWFNLCEGVK